MTYQNLTFERAGDIGKLTFSRPEVLNAYNRSLALELIDAFHELAADEAVKVIVLTGTGKAFMAGADINMVHSWTTLKDTDLVKSELAQLFNPNSLEDCPKPVIAAVNGFAFGMGCELALACDFRIAAATAKFALPEIKIGLIPGGGGSQRMLHLVGTTRALEMIATGDPIDAEEAYRIGLVNQIVPLEGLWEAVECFARRLSDKGGAALRACKKLIHEGGGMPLRQGVAYERDRFSEILLTEDAVEGTKAFLQKRKPIFKGR